MTSHYADQYDTCVTKIAGRKYDAGKPRMGLLPLTALFEVARVMTAGAEKYEDNNWQGVKQERYVSALLRHLTQWQDGEKYDAELKGEGCEVSHLACVACNALFILWLELQKGKK